MLVIGGGQRDLVPALAGGNAAVVEMPPFPGCAKPSSGTACAVRALSPISCTKVSMELLVAASALATDSVEGQRSRPSAVMRLDLLKVVGSRPDFFARPEADSPPRSASRSSAVQIWSWVSVFCAFGAVAMIQAPPGFRIYSLKRPPCTIRWRPRQRDP